MKALICPSENWDEDVEQESSSEHSERLDDSRSVEASNADEYESPQRERELLKKTKKIVSLKTYQ